MKKQTKADKLDESLGERRGKETTKKQSYKSRRDESVGASKQHKHHEKISHHLHKAHEALEKLHGSYKTKEAKAGHKYNESAKHRKAESRGMKKAMRTR